MDERCIVAWVNAPRRPGGTEGTPTGREGSLYVVDDRITDTERGMRRCTVDKIIIQYGEEETIITGSTRRVSVRLAQRRSQGG